jgi:hypothetical protein
MDRLDGSGEGFAAGCRIGHLHPRSSTSHRSYALRSQALDSANIPNIHHNGLPKLLICANLRQEDGDSIIAHTTYIRNSAQRSSAIRNIFHTNRAAHERYGHTSTTHHKVQNQTPPVKPQCSPSASITQQHHSPARRALLPPGARCPGMDHLDLQLQQGRRQDSADRRTHHKRPSRALQRFEEHRRKAKL